MPRISSEASVLLGSRLRRLRRRLQERDGDVDAAQRDVVRRDRPRDLLDARPACPRTVRVVRASARGSTEPAPESESSGRTSCERVLGRAVLQREDLDDRRRAAAPAAGSRRERRGRRQRRRRAAGGPPPGAARRRSMSQRSAFGSATKTTVGSFGGDGGELVDARVRDSSDPRSGDGPAGARERRSRASQAVGSRPARARPARAAPAPARRGARRCRTAPRRERTSAAA